MSESDDDEVLEELEGLEREVAQYVNRKEVIYQFEIPTSVQDIIYFCDNIIDGFYRAQVINHVDMRDIKIIHQHDTIYHLTFRSLYASTGPIPYSRGSCYAQDCSFHCDVSGYCSQHKKEKRDVELDRKMRKHEEEQYYQEYNKLLEHILEQPFPLTLENEATDVDGTIYNLSPVLIKMDN